MKPVLDKIIWHKHYTWMDFLQSEYLCDQIKSFPEKNELVHKIHLNVVFTCWHETCSWENSLAQKLHLNGFSLKWVFMWPGKISFWKITLVHKIHLNVVFKCWHEICSRQNYLAQRLHLNGFSSEWLFMWPDKISLWKNALIHKIHLNVVFK